jgi:succinoglycan biosynthesis protein ExoL
MRGSIDAREATDIPVIIDDMPLDADDMPMDAIDSRVADGPNLSFFCPDVTDASTLKRVQQFMDRGYRVTVFGFRRARYNTAYQPPWPNVPLGFTTDARYWQRISALLQAVPAVFARRATLARTSIFYARNIDQLLLALLARLISLSNAPVVYEVLDIAPIFVQRGLIPTLLRFVERRCLRRVQLLVVSSPGFHRNYFAAIQRYDGEWFLLENKLYPPPPLSPASARTGAERGRPWVVGYFGLIRGQATFDLIARLADRLQGKVLFKFGGVVTTVERARFDAVLRHCPNIVYSGPYLPQQDLAQLYCGVDFAWALDLENPDHNSRWLMPCRFYEAGQFGIPCLAVHGFEVGGAIEKRRIGWTFKEPLEDSLVKFFEQLTVLEYEQMRGRLLAMPQGAFVAGDDITDLCATLGRCQPGRSRGR